MPKTVLQHIKRKARHLTYGNAIYDWSLGGHASAFADRMPQTIWNGDAEQGQFLCENYFVLAGQPKQFDPHRWHADETDRAWIRLIHGFSWLADLKAVGGDAGRRHARDMVTSWIETYSHWHTLTWQPDLTGERLANWIGFYNFYGETAHIDFQDDLRECMMKQARHLARTLPGNLSGLPLFMAIKGLIYAGLAFDKHDHWLEQGLDLLEQETRKQILKDGGHISRSPAMLQEILQLYIDIQQSLAQCGYPVPLDMNHVIQDMAQALRFFRHTDKGYALFHGTQEGRTAHVDALLKRVNARSRTAKSLPHTGFEKMVIGRSVIIADASPPPPYPYETQTHAAPLSFEFCYGKERVFVNAGTHPFDDTWHDVLRNTAAHNTLTIDNRNAAEILESGHFGRKHRKVTRHREDKHDEALLDMTHDGYMDVNGITHRRRLYLGDYGHDLRGEESLTCSIGLNKTQEFAIRFHLHPRVQVSLIREGQEALLRLNGGSGWRFLQNGGTHIALENSIYLGEGTRPRKTKQLVIYGTIDTDYTAVQWALNKEG